MKTKAKTIIKYILLVLLGLFLAFLYSYIIKHDFSTGMSPVFAKDFSVEIIIVFFALYAYLITFMKFLIKLFK